MPRIIIFVVFLLTLSGISRLVFAQELTITGNGGGSENSIVVQSGSSINVRQGNSIDVVNDIKSSANTGGNSASGNSGNAVIQTGDATTEVDIKNFFNTNFVKTDCCATPAPEITPDPGSAVNPTSTPVPDPGSLPQNNTGSSSPSSSGGSSSGDGGGGTGGTQVLGLSATAGPAGFSEYAFYLAGALCLICAKYYSVFPEKLSKSV
ncbi:MAG: hypothetical protein UX91_C0006G0032 [Candidatus Amesbacteria bacterium GW2011_GWB1_47_19]|nr:MAG: hypothetical protein UW51_C0002G0032 [Candidatus Amesbacteria bacterium GW2011_GWA1_44_24]KKU31378.1 MAG: hypothetical protein UX46_C0006G0170 [Candidatus Amesbacteria bacterium GW2011_GWC1_46_24]KKU66970.1 MAG: hypothetical protein UX91_C0006G0032 [Candidatus Amesbacteria bacterium GW2011_GWB1_47_19]OGD06410.1 MAG: hypothetical protein A2379_02095 [Candidatus Amesbacteria bacterium RIFOXYB1_FULL_47_13]